MSYIQKRDFLIKNFEDMAITEKNYTKLPKHKPKKSEPPIKTGYELRSKSIKKAKIEKNQKIRSILHWSQYLTSHLNQQLKKVFTNPSQRVFPFLFWPQTRKNFALQIKQNTIDWIKRAYTK